MDVVRTPSTGWIEVVVGSMFSGKSEELIRRLRRAQIARQRVQIFKPAVDPEGKFIGLDHEAIFYDPEAFVAPVRATYRFARVATPDDPNRRYNFIECLSNISSVNGRPTQLTTGDPGYIDYYGRPWAQNWDKLEEGWDKPEPELPAIFGR